jgi:hypothetical protein
MVEGSLGLLDTDALFQNSSEFRRKEKKLFGWDPMRRHDRRQWGNRERLFFASRKYG